MNPASLTFLTTFIQSGEIAPLPAESPIGGPFWSLVIPTLLLAASVLGTFLLYRHFAKQKD